MSMRDYGFEDYGLILSEDEVRLLASKLCDDYSEEEYNRYKWDFVNELYYSNTIIFVSDFNGTAAMIANDGSTLLTGRDDFDADTIYYIPFDRCPSLFDVAYEDIYEIVSEMKAKVGKYLPDNFDYLSNLRHIYGTYLG